MKAVRFGSYSRRSTVAAMSSLTRLKSTMRYRRFTPPPRQRTVMRPELFRPPLLRSPSVSVLTGSPFQSSLRSTMTSCRCEGVVGLNVLSAIPRSPSSNTRRHVDLRALGEGDDRLLIVRALAEPAAEALLLAADAQRVDGLDLDAEEAFDRRLDLALGRGQRHAEDDLAVLGGGRRLLGDDRRADDRVHRLARQLRLGRRNDAKPAHLSRASRCCTAS